LKGSYAVYKKETQIGEGTGKLCHIHRPMIIDTRGRKIWGDLAVVGNELRITIPEQWLAEASYPVIVDPVIGTSTIGSLMTGPDPNNPRYDRPWLDGEFALNKYLVPQNGSGICTAFVYCYHNDADSFATPILYTNDDNKPFMRKSRSERDINVSVRAANPAGWRNNTFNINGSIATGENVWFGLFASWFTTRFDYGVDCYKGWFDWDTYEEYEGEPTPYIYADSWATFCNIRWSWYFTYTAITSQNFVRTLTQGVSLTDKREIAGEYKRSTIQTVGAKVNAVSIKTIFRKLREMVLGFDNNSFLSLFFRTQKETITVSEKKSHLRVLFRGLIDRAEIESGVETGRIHFIRLADTVQAAGVVFRGLLIFVGIVSRVFVRDYLLWRFLKARSELVLKSVVIRELNLESKIK
jgi:hypothetical protein